MAISSILLSQPAPSNSALFTGVDDVLSEVTLPFGFVIDGVSYTKVDVSSNGWIEFGGAATTSNAANTALPSAYPVGPMVAAFWDDLAGVTTFAAAVGEAPNRVYSIEWIGYRYQAGGNVPNSLIGFQIKLHEGSNVIGVSYTEVEDAATGETATIGYQHAGGNSARAYPLSFNAMMLFPDTGFALGQGWSVSPIR